MAQDDRYACLRLDNQLCFPLYVCAKEVVRRYKPVLDELDLTYTQYIAMMAMWEHRSMTVKDIGKALCLDSGTMTPVLKKLEDKGYISRSRDPSDERVVIVKVTDEGMALQDRALSVPGRMWSCLDMSTEDAATLKRILGDMMSGFEEERFAPPSGRGRPCSPRPAGPGNGSSCPVPERPRCRWRWAQGTWGSGSRGSRRSLSWTPGIRRRPLR